MQTLVQERSPALMNWHSAVDGAANCVLPPWLSLLVRIQWQRLAAAADGVVAAIAQSSPAQKEILVCDYWCN